MPGGVVVLAEHRENRLSRSTWEALRAGQILSSSLSLPLFAAVLGSDTSSIGAELSARAATSIMAIEHPLLAEYTSDGYSRALQQWIEASKPDWVLMSHTYQVRDFAPKLAAAMDRALIGDVVGFRTEGGPVFERQVLQGKLLADVRCTGEPPYFVSFQAGAIRADELENAVTPVPVARFEPQIDARAIRTEPLELFRGSRQAVDLTKADVIVAVGRGIKSQENIGLAARLAEVLDGELAASRPICDNEWLPMDRQIGSSGQTVSPRLYIALGISGAIQHLVGMKGSRTVVAINKDPDAPIFDIADYGIVGDLFEIVPALITEVTNAKSS